MTDPPPSDAARFLLSRVNFERNPLLASRRAFKLDRMRRLLAELGNPQERVPAVHIAGTKGKGSTAIMVASALSAAGIRTGLYTSPHVESFTERLRIDGRSPSPGEIDACLPRIAGVVARLDAESEDLAPTYFETLTALAWEYFARSAVEIVVLEVGLGGRLDATNVCRPEVTAITNISRDHTQILGDTLAAIAGEKAGIIKEGVFCVSGVREPSASAVIRDVANDRGAALVEARGRYHTFPPRRPGDPWRMAINDPLDVESGFADMAPVRVPFLGEHQADNAAVAHFVLEALARRGWPIRRDHIIEGWRNLAFPARIEVVGHAPAIVLDAAHNAASASALARTLECDFPAEKRVLLFAGSQEKDVAGILRQLAPLFDSAVLTAFQTNPRAMPIARLAQIWREITGREALTAETPAAALEMCRRIAGPRDLICATGSFFLAAEVRPLLIGVSK